MLEFNISRFSFTVKDLIKDWDLCRNIRTISIDNATNMCSGKTKRSVNLKGFFMGSYGIISLFTPFA